jgi:hypothetical protein
MTDDPMPIKDRAWEIAGLLMFEDDITDTYRGSLASALRKLRNAGVLSFDVPPESVEIWKALELKEGDQIEAATLVAKVVDFGDVDKTSSIGISIAITDGCDWVTQQGLLAAALDLIREQRFGPRRELED